MPGDIRAGPTMAWTGHRAMGKHHRCQRHLLLRPLPLHVLGGRATHSLAQHPWLSYCELHKADSSNSHTRRYTMEGGVMAQEV